MVPIKVEKFAKEYVETNKDEKLDDLIKRLEESLKRKNSGVKCSCCKSVISDLSKDLTKEYGKGYSQRNLFNMVKFLKLLTMNRFCRHCLQNYLGLIS